MKVHRLYTAKTANQFRKLSKDAPLLLKSIVFNSLPDQEKRKLIDPACKVCGGKAVEVDGVQIRCSSCQLGVELSSDSQLARTLDVISSRLRRDRRTSGITLKG